MTNINKVITIQFRVPKQFVDDFNEYIQLKGSGATPSGHVKSMFSHWLHNHLTNKLQQLKESSNG